MAIFAAVALLLAAIGIFGVLSYAVAQRTREIGIRMALGARERSVIRLIVRQAMLLVAAGVAVGSVAAWWLSQTLGPDAVTSTPTDPGTSRPSRRVLVGVALVAGYLPARRATRVDPIVALRAE